MYKLSSIQTFIIFCLEAYKNAKNMKPETALNDFEKYDIFNFLENAYDVLHSQSLEYIVIEISELIKNAK